MVAVSLTFVLVSSCDQDRWNVLDFTVVLLTWLQYVPAAYGSISTKEYPWWHPPGVVGGPMGACHVYTRSTRVLSSIEQCVAVRGPSRPPTRVPCMPAPLGCSQ
eukprot:6423082-Pyramimonas_sp.AAC.1